MDLIFDNPTNFSGSTLVLGAIFFAFQIYCDFSGYSDIAIGTSRLFGFNLKQNFAFPYFSRDIAEFWRRWHITLGNWMRDYLYIPLGGNRVNSKIRLYGNLWIVFLISGLWHGASWNFIIWGAYHGIFLVADRLFLDKITSKMGSIGRVLLTFVLVVLGWVLFRAEDLGHSMVFYKTMFSGNFEGLGALLEDKIFRVLMIAVLLSFGFVFQNASKKYEKFVESISLRNISFKAIISIVLIILSSSALVSSGFNPFIYFRF